MVLTSQGLPSGHSGHVAHASLVGSFQSVVFGDSCFTCGELGHFVRDCHRVPVQLARGGPHGVSDGLQPVRGSQRRSSSPSRRTLGQIVYFDCGEHGHWSRDCPGGS